MVALRHDVDHPDATAARDSAMRSLERPQAGGLRAAFLRALGDVELRNASGLYLGRAGAYNVDVERLDRVARRSTLGLFYKKTGRPLPSGYTAKAYLLSQIDPSATDAIARLSGMVDALRAETLRRSSAAACCPTGGIRPWTIRTPRLGFSSSTSGSRGSRSRGHQRAL